VIAMKILAAIVLWILLSVGLMAMVGAGCPPFLMIWMTSLMQRWMAWEHRCLKRRYARLKRVHARVDHWLEALR